MGLWRAIGDEGHGGPLRMRAIEGEDYGGP